MGKQLVNFVCQECGYDSPQWLGKCPECGNWNTMKEFKVLASGRSGQSSKVKFGQKTGPSSLRMTDAKPEPLSKVQFTSTRRIPTGFAEMDSVLGGGIVPGSAILLAGDPGIGKSTLLLQLALNLASNNVFPEKAGIQKDRSRVKLASLSRSGPGMTNEKNEIVTPSQKSTPVKKVLYLSAEESVEQVAMRAARLTTQIPNQENLLLLSLTDTDQIVETIQDTKPSLVIIDSIQTVESENAGGLAGSIGQVRYSAMQFIRLAKQNGIPIILVGHVTKEGMVAGPMVLSHMVDTVLFLEGGKVTSTRILRSFKNRFGPVDEVGIFQMEGQGMVEVRNPEQIFLSQAEQSTPGSVLVVIMEGTRPFLIEIQALVVYSKLPIPRRVASGMDSKRLELLLAVLQKHCRLGVESSDVFINIAGGIKVTDPGVDLGVCLAIYSSLKNIALNQTVGIAEIGLLGELRKVGGLDKRIREAKKLGFSKVITAQEYKTLLQVLESIEGKKEKI